MSKTAGSGAARPAVRAWGEPRLIAVIALAGAAGSLGRWLLGVLLPHTGTQFPVSTLLVNVTGALGMGVLVGWLEEGRSAPWIRPVVGVGFLGGWTTMSALALDVHALAGWSGGDGGLVALGAYLGLTVVGGIGACLIGLRIGESRGQHESLDENESLGQREALAEPQLGTRQSEAGP